MLLILFFLLYFIYTKPGKELPTAANETVQAKPLQRQPLSISQIAIDPQNSEHLYISTLNAGIFRSLDRGKSWRSINEGLKNLMINDLVIDSRRPHLLYAATFGGGIYRSENEGASWVETNEGLSNTNIAKLVFHPSDPDTLYAMSISGGVFKSLDGSRSWTALTAGIPLLELKNNFTFLPLPLVSSLLYLGTSDGILVMKEGKSPWEPAGGSFKEKQVTTLAYRPQSKTLIAAVFSQGLFQSNDFGKSWLPLGDGFTEGGVYSFISDPSDPMSLYIASTARGVLKSGDGGESWTEINNGFPKKGALKVVMDPRDHQILYATLPQENLFVSNDGGKNWRSLGAGFGDAEMVKQAFLARIDKEALDAGGVKGISPPPEAFKKCARCHGWTEPIFNLKSNSWRVTPSRREWTVTVKRMRRMIADMTDEEEAALIHYFNTNFGRGAAPSGKRL